MKKKTKAFSHPLAFLTYPILAALVILPGLLLQREIWIFSPLALHFPLTNEVFEGVFKLLGGFRIVIPMIFSFPVLGGLTFLGPALLLLLFGLLMMSIPLTGALRIFLCFVICSALSIWGLPGEAPTSLATLVGHILIMTPLFTKLRPHMMWALCTVAVGLSFLFESLRPLTFWAVFSISMSRVVTYLFVQRMNLPRHEKNRLFFFGLESIGYFALSIWVLTTLLQSSMTESLLGPSPQYWISALTGVLCAVACFSNPWNAELWLGLATFSQGSLIFKTFDEANFILMIYIALHFIGMAKEAVFKSGERMPRWASVFMGISVVASATALNWWVIKESLPERRLDTAWLTTAKILSSNNEANVFVVGDALAFLATFHRGKIVSDDALILETSEEEWRRRLEELNLSYLVIDENYLKAKWSQWIESGRPAKDINRSVLSRLINYQGKAVKTPTLKLDALKLFEIEHEKDLPNHFTFARVLK